jgi:hypothetical protein
MFPRNYLDARKQQLHKTTTSSKILTKTTTIYKRWSREPTSNIRADKLYRWTWERDQPRPPDLELDPQDLHLGAGRTKLDHQDEEYTRISRKCTETTTTTICWRWTRESNKHQFPIFKLVNRSTHLGSWVDYLRIGKTSTQNHHQDIFDNNNNDHHWPWGSVMTKKTRGYVGSSKASCGSWKACFGTGKTSAQNKNNNNNDHH